MKKRVGVVGAGLSGLACAVELEKQGFEVELHEKSNMVGGRVKTEDYQGFLLDHGFQVYLPSYEMGEYYFDYKKLNLKSFSAGAKVFNKGRFQSLSDPLREPGGVFETLSNQLGSFKDKVLILKLKAKASKIKKADFSSQSTKNFLEDFGFSNKFISNFFNPFFSGIFLEKELESSSSFFLYLFNKFSTSEASVPEMGMKALPEQLASSLDSKSIVFKSEVIAVEANKIVFSDGSEKEYDFVVVATTPDATNKILNSTYETKFNSTWTYYFKTESKDFAEKKLFLNSNEDRSVNHIACLSAVNSMYAPKGWQLFSVTTVGAQEHELSAVKSDLEKLFGEKEINTWQHLKTHHVKQALPSKPLYSPAVLKKNGVYICGDFTSSPSIQGALSSGYQVAQEITKL